MIIDRICYEQLYPTGVYANQRYRAEATLIEGDDIMDCFFKLKKTVEDAFVDLNPQISWGGKAFPHDLGLYVPRQTVTEDDLKTKEPDQIQAMKDLLNGKWMTSKSLVEKQRAQVEKLNDESLTKLFEEKLKSFQ